MAMINSLENIPNSKDRVLKVTQYREHGICEIEFVSGKVLSVHIPETLSGTPRRAKIKSAKAKKQQA